MAPLAPGLVIGAPQSGAGKTMLTIGLQRAFARRGLRVKGAKCGPDYIDPAFHRAAIGHASVNLDGFAMEVPLLRGLAARAAENADLVIAEGAMGLFDGARAAGRSGAPADIARLLDWPMLLVIDARAAAQSIAAIAHGCATFPGAPRIAGIIVNRVASERHARMIEDGFARIALPLLGTIRRDDAMALPERHLGLVQAGETEGIDARIDAIADRIAGQCDLDAIRAAASPTARAPLPPLAVRPPGQRIAVARDDAFSFLYPHLLDAWRAAGAELRFFSPLADDAPAEDCDACWLPGGYPELRAARIAANRGFLTGLRTFAATRPVHGECGGYMVLGRTLQDADGTTHAMAGLLPVDTSMARRKLTLGYRRATLRHDAGFAPAGRELFGHEFHYATITASEGEPLADMADAEGNALPPAGHRAGNVTGSFFHLIA
ncbi:cobyrinate a,c-diamide synthase [Sphingomonas sp. dw_22]|uniref:cobyrinate a,c-diamide synthase n=1 Tax=Sphingomonas sp. dw_22 TaxID=2721175 RepID=UPI001BD25663|nr:cobyrinate a,c-diamide synthase [Sphingomonas sp. dw_22]